MLHFSEIYPVPGPGPIRLSAVPEEGAERTICIEQNATGQFERFMKTETGYECGAISGNIDGRPFILEELVREVKQKWGE